MNLPRIFLAKIGGKVGSVEVTAEELGEKFGTKPRAIQATTGVTKLFRFGPDESLVGISVMVARDVLARAGLDLGRVDGVFASSNPTTKTLMPGYATQVASELGLRYVLADQIGMGCGGGMQALRAAYDRLVVDSLHGKTSNYLVFAGDAVSVILNDKDRNTGLLFSEGVSVLLVTNDIDFGQNSYEITKINTMSVLGDGINMMRVMNEFHSDTDRGQRDQNCFTMDGKGVAQFGMGMIPCFLKLVEEEMFGENWMLFPHQPNLRMLEEMARFGNVPLNQVYTNGIKTIGNASVAAAFLGLEDGLQSNLFDRRCTVLLGAFGAELTVGAALLRPVGDPIEVVL